MKAMILAAGRGERLLPLTESIPKPLIPISSEPIIVHQIRWLHRAGIKEIVINLYHLSDQITKHLGNGGDLGVRIQYVHENTLLDTGG
ncbi:MAG: NTP transferase domain-containing protein, partial [Pseudomonadales bacterium]|nr:NTP transferase domain-containing protein [Pseudomonadales bacterium]